MPGPPRNTVFATCINSIQAERNRTVDRCSCRSNGVDHYSTDLGQEATVLNRHRFVRLAFVNSSEDL